MRAKSNNPKTPGRRAVKDIRRATRRQYSAEEKIRIVLWSAPTEWSGCNVSAWTVSALEA